VRKARLSVTVLLVLPAAMAVMCVVGGAAIDTTTLSGKWLAASVPATLVVGALLMLAEQVARAGRKHEAYLWHLWGGPPLNQAIQGHGTEEHRQTWAMIRDHLESQVGKPNDDPKSRHLETELKEATRDVDRFPRVFAENCSYGFRRNLWGVKSWGIASSLFAVVTGGVLIWMEISQPIWPVLPIATLIVGLVGLVLWMFVNRTFVHQAALAYTAAMRNAGTKLLQEARRDASKDAGPPPRSDVA
ncbi:MAG: hypothetical protein AAF745_08270, partial [Planctomycetota bacterium]